MGKGLIMYEYIGNIHIHSTYSDGGYNIDKIAKLASRANLDFIIITDHETLKGLDNGEEGYKYKVLTLIGEEINDTSNHYLALNIKEVIPNNTKNPQVVINEVNEQGGFGIIAHPVEKGSPLYKNGITYNWTDYNVTNFQGIEIWNYLSQWKDGIRGILSGLYLLINPHPALIGPYPVVMEWLDKLQKAGEKIMIYGGSDAHNTKIKLGPIILSNIGSYYHAFKCINMHILLENKLTRNFIIDKKSIYHALLSGNAWVSYDYYKNSKGFRFILKTTDKTYHTGSEVKLAKDMNFIIKIPSKAKVLIMKNGAEWKILDGDYFIIEVKEKGVYRLEVYHKHGRRWYPWIYSNSIWIV